eukprot:3775132-Prymnesium_polylepis.1
MAGQQFHIGRWHRHTRGVSGGVAGTAPLVVYAADLRTSAVLSPFSSFMSASQHFDGVALSYGLLPTVTEVPEGHVLEVVLALGRGVQSALLRWGDLLLRTYGKQRRDAWRRDPTLRSLGYCTQNGAYYYYNPMKGRTYEETILAVAKYAQEHGVPYKVRARRADPR